MVDKTTANYIEANVLDEMTAFRKALAVEYAGCNKFQLIDHIKANAPGTNHGVYSVTTAARQELAIEALEKLLWDERKTD